MVVSTSDCLHEKRAIQVKISQTHFLVNDSDYQILSERVQIYNDMALCSESQYRHLSKPFKPNLI